MQKPGAGLGQRHKVPGRAYQAQPARRRGTPVRSLGYRYCLAVADASRLVAGEFEADSFEGHRGGSGCKL